MKKLIAILLAVLLILAMPVSVSAATTMQWDWGKAQESINNAATDLIQDEQAEFAATEYVVVEQQETGYAETEHESVTNVECAQVQSWHEWLHNWYRWWSRTRH